MQSSNPASPSTTTTTSDLSRSPTTNKSPSNTLASPHVPSSTRAQRTHSAYNLPPLRLGPSPGSSAIGLQRPAPPVPSTPVIVSSAKTSSGDRRSSDVSSVLAGTKSSSSHSSHAGHANNGSGSGHVNGNASGSNTNNRPGFGPRTLSLVESLSGKSKRSSSNSFSREEARDGVSENGRSVSPISRSGSEGTISELREREDGGGKRGSGLKEKGLKRFGSLLKR